MATSISRTRGITTTSTAARVKAVLDLFGADVVGFVVQGLMSKERMVDWLGDLHAVLVLDAVERFQVKIAYPDGRLSALDYEVSDDGSIGNSDESGGFSTSSLPVGSTASLLVRWRVNAPRLEEAREVLRARGWGVGTMLEATGPAERAYADGGYGVYRRTVGELS